MKVKSIVIIIMIGLIFKIDTLNASGTIESITKSVQPFRILTVKDDLQVIIRDGIVPSVTIEGDSKKINTIGLIQQGDQLILSRKGLAAKNEKAVVYVTVSNLRIIEVTGNAHVRSAGSLSGDLLWVKLAGDGEVDLQTNARKVLTTSWADGRILIHGNYQLCSTYRSASGRLVTAYTNSSTADIINPED